jgi:erythromycin esterase
MAAAREPSDARVDWLKKHAVPLRTLDPADEDFADLEPLRKIIGDARIVQLGEQSHGDGATFHAKARLIKFLHQKMGFSVFAIESGLYDCYKAWSQLQGGSEPRAALNQGIFGIWMSSEQFKPVVDYLGKAAQSDRPLEVCSFDCQFTAKASETELEKDVQRVLEKLDPKALSVEQRKALSEAIADMKKYERPKTEEAYKSRLEALRAWQQALQAAQPAKNFPAEELALWRQLSVSITAHFESIWAAGPKREFPIKSGSLRDAQMARNLVWLAKEKYPNRKIIVWAASFHLMRNQGGVEMPMRKDFYKEIVTMGNEAWKELAKETYTLAFTAAEGEAGLPWRAPTKLKPLPEGSLEKLCVAAGLENAVIDFRHLDDSGAWLKEKLFSRPLGHSDMTAQWPQHFDGVLFTRKMYPSTRLKEEGKK